MIFSTNTVVFFSESLKLLALTRILKEETEDSFTKNLDLFKAFGVTKTEKIKCKIKQRKRKKYQINYFYFFIQKSIILLVHFVFQILRLTNLKLIKMERYKLCHNISKLRALKYKYVLKSVRHQRLILRSLLILQSKR